MTTVVCRLNRPDKSGTDKPAGGHLEFRPSARRIVGDTTVLPIPFSVALVNGEVTVDLAPTPSPDPWWYWEVTERIPQGTTRHVLVPESGPVDYEDLMDTTPQSTPGVPIQISGSETTTLQLRRNTAAGWTSGNPVLKNGEVGIVEDATPAKLKVGDGVTAWNALDYTVDPALWLTGRLSATSLNQTYVQQPDTPASGDLLTWDGDEWTTQPGSGFADATAETAAGTSYPGGPSLPASSIETAIDTLDGRLQDTGWRNIASLLDSSLVLAAAAPMLHLRRVGDTCYLKARVDIPPASPLIGQPRASTQVTVLSSLPAGFTRASLDFLPFAVASVGASGMGIVVAASSHNYTQVRALGASGNFAAADRISFYARWQANTAFPSEPYPGTAA